MLVFVPEETDLFLEVFPLGPVHDLFVLFVDNPGVLVHFRLFMSWRAVSDYLNGTVRVKMIAVMSVMTVMCLS